MPHLHEKIDFTAEVFIVHKDKVLLRKHDKYSIWLSIGGHVELDEDPNQAAIREVKEEVGLDIELWSGFQTAHLETTNFKDLIPPAFLNRHRINETHEHVSFVYFGRSTSDVVINQESEHSDAIEWFSLEEMDNPQFSEQVRTYAKAALTALS